MLKLSDSGCAQHPQRHTTLTGLAATLVSHLIVNLPQTNVGHSYICEHGHTHCLTLQALSGSMAKSPPRLGLTGKTAPNQ